MRNCLNLHEISFLKEEKFREIRKPRSKKESGLLLTFRNFSTKRWRRFKM